MLTYMPWHVATHENDIKSLLVCNGILFRDEIIVRPGVPDLLNYSLIIINYLINYSYFYLVRNSCRNLEKREYSIREQQGIQWLNSEFE